jgi:hypothetical protein
VQTAKKKLEEGGFVTSQHEGLIVDVMLRASDSSTTTSPLTESSLSTSSSAISSSVQQTLPIKRRQLPKQASEARVLAKIKRDDYNRRFKLAFKAGTDLVHQRLHSADKPPPSGFSSVNAIVSQLNKKFQLNYKMLLLLVAEEALC